MSSGAPSCTPALSGQSQGGQDKAISSSPQTSLPFSGFRTFSLQIGKLRPEQNRGGGPDLRRDVLMALIRFAKKFVTPLPRP